MDKPADLVYIDENGLIGSNFYWHKHEAHGLSKEDILSAGLENERVQVSSTLVPLLQDVDRELREQGKRLYVKEGYRSKELYRVVYDRRVEKYGKEATDRLLNIDSMPHALGLSVDVTLFDTETSTEIPMRNKEDGIEALFIGFYRNKPNESSKQYQELQDLLAGLMLQRGFRIGLRREYFHFDYRPEQPENYL
jgi:D-alanyl-D-alanine dipeptidase